MKRFLKRAAWVAFAPLAALFLFSPPVQPSSLPVDAVQIDLPVKYIAITFDDGPRRASTTVLLDGLAQRGVRATFFLIGELVPGSEDLLQRMVLGGHEIGIHSYTHGRLTALNDADFAAEVERTRVVLRNATGQETFLHFENPLIFSPTLPRFLPNHPYPLVFL